MVVISRRRDRECSVSRNKFIGMGTVTKGGGLSSSNRYPSLTMDRTYRSVVRASHSCAKLINRAPTVAGLGSRRPSNLRFVGPRGRDAQLSTFAPRHLPGKSALTLRFRALVGRLYWSSRLASPFSEATSRL